MLEICDDFRDNRGIENTDVAILISPLSYRRFFSLFEHNRKNIFVCTENWELFSNAEKPLLIAHQVVENILQCLAGFDEKNAHDPSIGCINDMCIDKLEITLKLRTADICPECIQLFLKGEVTNAMLFESMKFLEDLRKDFLLQNSYSKNLNPLKLTCKKNNKGNLEIYIGEQLIKFTKTELFLYYVLCMGKEKGNNFFKFNEEEISLQDIRNFKQIKTNLYFGVQMLGNIRKNVNFIKNKLNEALGANLASFYIIKKKSEVTKERKLKLMNELEQLVMKLNELNSNMQLDKKNKAIQRNEIEGSIKDINTEMNSQREKVFPYVIELFTRNDWNKYFEQEGF